MSTRRPVSQLAPTTNPTMNGEGSDKSSTAAHLLLWFVIIGLISWFLLYALKPTVVQKVGPNGKATGEPDVGKSLLGALLIALVIVLIIWLIRASK